MQSALLKKYAEVKYIYNECFNDESWIKETTKPVPGWDILCKLASTIRGEKFFSNLFDYPVLTREQEQHLFKQFNLYKHLANKTRKKLEKDPTAADAFEKLHREIELIRQVLLICNIKLVAKFMTEICGSKTAFAILGEGIIPLSKAINNFDFSRGYKFSTYFRCAIKRHMLRANYQTISTQSKLYELENIPERENTFTQKRMETLPDLLERLEKVMPRGKQICEIIRRYNAINCDQESMETIGKSMNTSRQNIRHMYVQGVKKLAKLARQLYPELLTT